MEKKEDTQPDTMAWIMKTAMNFNYMGVFKQVQDLLASEHVQTGLKFVMDKWKEIQNKISKLENKIFELESCVKIRDTELGRINKHRIELADKLSKATGASVHVDAINTEGPK